MSSASNDHKSIRIAELDALRGIAALAVVFYHFTMQPSLTPANRLPVSFAFSWGDLGVPLFFMISGFVIIMTLDRVANVQAFALGRFSRLYPTFWACVLLTFCTLALFDPHSHHVGLRDLLWNLTMLPHLLAHAPLVDGVYWTLEYELLFYAAMALLFKLGALKRVNTVLMIWMLLARVVAVIVSHYEPGSLPFVVAGKMQTAAVLQFIHFFSIGVVLYDVRRCQRWKLEHGLVLSLAMISTFLTEPTAARSFVVVGLALVCWAASAGSLPFLKWAPLTLLGSISYPLYLLHQKLGHAMLAALSSQGWWPLIAFVATVFMMILLAYVMSVSVEQPAMRWLRDRLRKPRPEVPAGGASAGFVNPSSL